MFESFISNLLEALKCLLILTICGNAVVGRAISFPRAIYNNTCIYVIPINILHNARGFDPTAETCIKENEMDIQITKILVDP